MNYLKKYFYKYYSTILYNSLFLLIIYQSNLITTTISLYKDIINITLNQWNIHESLFEEIFLQILFNKFCIISLLVIYQSNLLIFITEYHQYYVNPMKYSWIIKHMSVVFFSHHTYIFTFVISVILYLLGNFITDKYSGKSMLML